MNTSKLKAREYLTDVPEEYVFRSCTGRTLRNLKELSDELSCMSDTDFCYHVNAEKNDFRNWVRDIIRDQELSRRLQRSLDRLESARFVANRIRQLSGK